MAVQMLHFPTCAKVLVTRSKFLRQAGFVETLPYYMKHILRRAYTVVWDNL